MFVSYCGVPPLITVELLGTDLYETEFESHIGGLPHLLMSLQSLICSTRTLSIQTPKFGNGQVNITVTLRFFGGVGGGGIIVFDSLRCFVWLHFICLSEFHVSTIGCASFESHEVVVHSLSPLSFLTLLRYLLQLKQHIRITWESLVNHSPLLSVLNLLFLYFYCLRASLENGFVCFLRTKPYKAIGVVASCIFFCFSNTSKRHCLSFLSLGYHKS